MTQHCSHLRAFVCGLQERNALENVQRWACGRPTPSELATISDALDEAGLMDLDPGAPAILRTSSCEPARSQAYDQVPLPHADATKAW
jgi:hypothetical protein